MRTIIKYLQLPFHFSPDQLAAELSALKSRWIMHFNKAHYEGEWSALPLRSVGGSLDHVIPGNTGKEKFADTPLVEQCPYMQSILAHFPCEHRAVRLLRLAPGAVIKEHRDAELFLEQGEARIHVPVLTNPQVEFYLGGERVTMQAGDCWYMNFNLPHSIVNCGSSDRVHLVMDIVVNDAIRQMFDAVAPEHKKLVPEDPKITAAALVHVIEQLKKMNTETSLRLAAEMEAEG